MADSIIAGAARRVIPEDAGDREGLPVAVVQTAYRVVQEAMTNALHYAGGAEVQVAVDGTGDGLLVEIANGPARGGVGPIADVGTGNGLRGLPERSRRVAGSWRQDPPAPVAGWSRPGSRAQRSCAPLTDIRRRTEPLKPGVIAVDALCMAHPSFPAVALAGLATLLLAGPAQAAPTGQISGRDAGNGGWEFAATVTWDGCPQLCDWQINVDDVSDPSLCAQSSLQDATSRLTAGFFGNRAPYAENGTRIDGVTGIGSILPALSDQHHVLCLAAVGLSPSVAPWTFGDPAPVYPENCHGSAPFYATLDTSYMDMRCAVLYPLGYTVVDVKAGAMPTPKPLTLTTLRPASPRAVPASPLQLTRAQAVRSLRAKHVKGKVSCRRLTAVKQRCTATAKRRKRTYTVTRSGRGVRVTRRA